MAVVDGSAVAPAACRRASLGSGVRTERQASSSPSWPPLRARCAVRGQPRNEEEPVAHRGRERLTRSLDSGIRSPPSSRAASPAAPMPVDRADRRRSTLESTSMWREDAVQFRDERRHAFVLDTEPRQCGHVSHVRFTDRHSFPPPLESGLRDDEPSFVQPPRRRNRCCTLVSRPPPEARRSFRSRTWRVHALAYAQPRASCDSSSASSARPRDGPSLHRTAPCRTAPRPAHPALRYAALP